MPQNISVENNFIGGLKTEFTGLNFPENAATDTQNCVYTIIGDVLRRSGIDYEVNFAQLNLDRTDQAVSSFKWDNAGGDGVSQLVVLQTGVILSFFKVNSATITNSLSNQIIPSTVNITSFNPGGGVANPAFSECQYAIGNGYLFVFHPNLEPFYCSYDSTSNTVSANVINISIRDFDGIVANGGSYDARPVTGNAQMTYNWENQGWTSLQLTQFFGGAGIGYFPSNSDVWFLFKDSTGTFNPTGTMLAKLPFSNTPAPRGHFVLKAFNQQRGAIATLPSLTDITTSIRPKTGTWFQGRAWYAGADSSVPAFGTAPAYTWTEKIYFSQIADDPTKFGNCYQLNDPTSEALFDLLPSDGGVIVIQGSGSIYKLFPIQNGLLVFAANGIWFITGSQGIGFTANDYTITKISSIQSISGSSFVSVLGWPVFWNEEGIYAVSPSDKGGLEVTNLALGTILTYYSDIPLQSKKFVKGAYNPVDFIIQWTFRSTNESTISTRYEFDTILNYNTANKAFYPYTITNAAPKVNGIIYVSGPGGSTTPDPVFKYIVSSNASGSYKFSFAEERDSTHYKDWFSVDGVGIDYTSYFITGYKLRGKAITKWQPTYVNILSGNLVPGAYSIQGYWDYALANADGRSDSNRTSIKQTILNNRPYFGNLFRRHKIRGHGYSLQFKVTSVSGYPFDIMGWSILENIQQSA